MKKKLSIVIILIICLSIIGVYYYNKKMSKTEIALVNFQPFLSSPIATSNNNPHVHYNIISTKEFCNSGKNYSMAIVFGMGLRMDAKERKNFNKYLQDGYPLMVIAATTPENDLANIDSTKMERIGGYLSYGNKKNYQSLSNYIRKYIDHKTYGTVEPDTIYPTENNVFYHINDNVAYKNIDNFNKYLKKIGYYHEGAPRIAILSTLIDPFSGGTSDVDSLITSLNRKGFNVYPIYTFQQRLDYINQVKPNAIIYYAHGRLAFGDGIKPMLEALKKYNCPVFIPLTLLSSKKQWLNSKLGMMGGYMSQSIVMPEIDGCIYPYVLNVQQKNKYGVTESVADPQRLVRFTDIVANMLKLKSEPNKDKKIAIFYFKGPGQEGLTAQGLEVVPSIYNVLAKLKKSGYSVDLPPSADSLRSILMNYAPYEALPLIKAEKNNYKPVLIDGEELNNWMQKDLTREQIQRIEKTYGKAPGNHLTTEIKQKVYLNINAIRLGNIVLLPQEAASLGSDEFAMVHGVDTPPPYSYIAPYLWVKEGFHANAIIHFGTHGSLEFTPKKQLALSQNDWPDALIGTIPHFYIYTIANVGEGMIAKRRAYATLITYLTPAFQVSNMRTTYTKLKNYILSYNQATNDVVKDKYAQLIKKEAISLGIASDLKLDTTATARYSSDVIEHIDDYAEEIANEKIYTKLYTMGQVYTAQEINQTVKEMCADPIGYALAAIDRANKKLSLRQYKNESYISSHYLQPAGLLVERILGGYKISDDAICHLAGITKEELKSAFNESQTIPNMMGMMGMMGKKTQHKKVNQQDKDKAISIRNLVNTIHNIDTYKIALESSPNDEMNGILNALNGGYIPASSGGDAVANPKAIPTGRNMYAINEEATPSDVAWSEAKIMVDNTLNEYKKKHGVYPKKVSYTFWSGAFISSQGTTLAQALYMMGVEPVRDMMGRVKDVRLIPSDELGRPRIDILVQTSGQFRDIATSRLLLLDKAVNLAVAAGNKEKYPNYVYQGNINTEKTLVKDGLSPKEARSLAHVRIFGGLNGMYGTGTMGMVLSGDKWDSSDDIAKVYINNMGAAYTSTNNWGDFTKGLFSAALANTDIIVQPRQSNTWGPLSLDHVFEFMGGLNLAVKHVTGKSPDAVFADYRNTHHYKIQDLQEAIGVESRSTILNPFFIKNAIKGGTSNAMRIMDVIENTYGWSVTKPEVINKALWDGIYNNWIKDDANLGTKAFFENKCPAALEQITGVMLETIRKGLWKATPEQTKYLASLNADLISKYGFSNGSFTATNGKLRTFISNQLQNKEKVEYQRQLQQTKQENTKQGVVLKEESKTIGANEQQKVFSMPSLKYILIGIVVILIVVVVIIRIRKKDDNE